MTSTGVPLASMTTRAAYLRRTVCSPARSGSWVASARGPCQVVTAGGRASRCAVGVVDQPIFPLQVDTPFAGVDMRADQRRASTPVRPSGASSSAQMP